VYEVFSSRSSRASTCFLENFMSRRDISLDSSDEDSRSKFECCRFLDRNWESVIAHELILLHVRNFFSSFILFLEVCNDSVNEYH
jgi:hypothetical protein